jgi:hypothetical protein
VGEYVAAFFWKACSIEQAFLFLRVMDGSENPLRSKECSEQPDPKGHAQKEIKL